MYNHYICPDCGAHLDPGEPCDCQKSDIGTDDEIHQYRAIGTVKECREAMEMRTSNFVGERI